MAEIIPQIAIESRIHLIRNKKVMLDRDLAELYEVTTGNLNKAVKRNIERFPEDFMFQLSQQEAESLRFQFGSLKRGQNIKYLPFAFTEQGVAMLSGVLNSSHAVIINIQIMRAFVRIRNLVSDNSELRRAIETIERRVDDHDQALEIAFNTLKKFMVPKELLPKEYSPEEKKKMGFGKDKGNHG
jgi:ORF6N domain